jgi:EmrB/QacA subfamily drug resistance transporter
MTRQQRLVLVIAILASFVAFLDGSVITVALPAMSEELGGGLAVQQWIVDAYLITLGSLILVAGSLSDLYGRILIIRIGLIGFGITSVLIAIAPTAELVIVLRALQGIAGALLVPSSLAMIMTSFRDAAQAKAIGHWTAWTTVAFVAGPILGGLFVDFLSWRLVFAINVIPIAVTLWLLAVLGQKDVREPGTRVDFVGAVLGALGLGGTVFALIEQERFGWGSPVIWVPLLVGVVCLAAFLWWEARTKQPMLPLSLFRIRNFSAGNLATLFVYGALGIGQLVLVVFLQQVAGYPATLAALAMLPVSIGLILLSSYFGGLAGKYGPRLFMTVGPIIMGVGFLLFLTMGERVDYLWHVLPGTLVFALGLAVTVAPLTAAILGPLPERQAGVGSATNNAVARIASLITIAMLGIIVAGSLDVAGFHRALVFTAVLFFVGGVISLLGIRNPSPVDAAATPAADPPN